MLKKLNHKSKREQKKIKKKHVNRETMFWEKSSGGNLVALFVVALNMKYAYFITGHKNLGKIVVAAACPNREWLTETLLLFSERGYYCLVDKIGTANPYGVEPN